MSRMGDESDKTADIQMSYKIEVNSRNRISSAHSNWIGSCEYSEDGSQLLTSSYDRTGKIWSSDNFTKPIVSHNIPIGTWTSGATFLTGESHFVIWRKESEVFVCPCDPDSLQSPKNIIPPSIVTGALHVCTRNPGKENSIGVSTETGTLLFDITNQTYVRSFGGGTANTFSENGDILYYAEGSSIIRSDLRSPDRESTTLAAVTSPTNRMTIQYGNNILYYTSSDNIYGYSLDTEKRLFIGSNHKGEVMYVDAQKHGDYVISSSRDSTAILWDGLEGRPVAVLYGNASDSAFSATLSPLSSQIAVGSMYNLFVFDVQMSDRRVLVKSARK